MTHQGICSYFVLMPEGYRPDRKALSILLSDHERDGFLVRVSCYCGSVRHYHPGDLKRLFGNIPILSVRSRLRKCAACGEQHTLKVDFLVMSEAERMNAHVLRLVGVKTKRIPIWEDE
ncbi:hypothetical protein [Pararhizobium mangrovi]|uniref:Uncharacterized protein n=1 Tax=Pararhizobium mangrovi TaxID=2590452 RepID=A0A506TY22_9HYPH|nr:hypothetical protein [Pararhizobium mangrovi]TPW26400.1 hypothetical protein FJU11_15095 [Pararhizobium mangrovi]